MCINFQVTKTQKYKLRSKNINVKLIEKSDNRGMSRAVWDTLYMHVHWRPGFREGWKMMDLSRRPETLWSQFHGGCREREVMVFARAKVAFFPECEKMTRKASRTCVKIKHPVFLSCGLSRILRLAKTSPSLASSHFKKKEERKREKKVSYASTTFYDFRLSRS